jgi:hypothetical protein
MLISSRPSQMAYVLSNYRSSTSCTGQLLFKFDPKTIAASVWSKKTKLSSLNNCYHLGLTFGRSETMLYAFSNYNSLSTITLLDIRGNSIWQYSTTTGHLT